MIKMSHIATVLLLASISVAHAQTPLAQTPPKPAAQGDASVDKNLNKNPDNKGLQTADKKVEANEAKAAEKRAEHKEARKEERKEERKKDRKEDKHERMERHEKMERPAKPERPAR
jgi:hypothetical protein